jgi:ABC-type branched-subunit amino acid transport system substrate-binding protein
MRKPFRIALAWLVLLAACPKRVVVNGQEMSAADAQAEASRELARVRGETQALPPDEAATRFEALAARFGDVPASGDALFEAGVRWRAAKNPERARSALSQLLTRFPLSPRAPEAKYQLALAEAEAGRPRDALATLSTLHDKLPTEQRPEAARQAAGAAEAARAWPAAVRWHAEVARLVGGAERDAALARAVELVDGELSLADLQKLEGELPPDSPVLPAASVKLARIQLHLQDEAAALVTAQKVAERWPSSPWAADARALADRLARRNQVHATTIGVAVPLSGKQKSWGEAILQGVSLALEGSVLQVVVRDTRGEPEGAQAAMNELAADEGAIAALGGVVNAEAPRAASAAQESGLPFISLSRAENVTAAGPFVFRHMLTAEAQAKALAELTMARRGMRRFALLYPQVPYGQELAQAFWDEVDARGGEVRGAESYEFDRTTFAPIVKSLVGKLWLDDRQDYAEAVKAVMKDEPDPYRRRKALEKLRDRLPPVTDFDAVFIPDFARNVALVTPALAVEDVVTQTCDPREVERIKKTTGRDDLRPVQLLGANGWDDPALVERAGKYVECAIFVDGFYAASERPETKAFVAAFQAKYNHPPSILEASAYDAARLLRRALEGGAATRDAVRDALATTRGFAGATGELSFDARREVQKPLFFLTVDKGAIRELTPQELAAPGAGGS